MTDHARKGDGVTRLSFIKGSAGAAAGLAAAGVPVAAAAAAGAGSDKPGVPTEPSAPTPPEPVVAYVRHAERGEVTVVSGTSEVTYRDPALARRLLAAAPQASILNGGSDVLAP
jgi:hypothetical protein